MSLIDTITVPQISVSDKEILIEDKGQKLFLHDDHMHINSSGDWNIWDEELGMMAVRHFDNDMRISKNSIYCVQSYFRNDGEKYIVEIAGHCFVFATKKEAVVLRNRINQWRWGDE